MTYEDFAITEPFPEWAWPSAWMWIEGQLGQVADDFFPRSLPEFVERSLKAYTRTFGLWIHGSLSGAIAFEQHGPVVATAHILLSRRLWGVPADQLRKVAARMFETQPELMRLQCYVPAWNRLALALARRIGCTVEGSMRAATLRGGKPADALLLAMTRGEFYGTELRRIDWRDQQQLDRQQHDGGDVLPDADGSPEPDRELIVRGRVGRGKRRSVAGDGGAGDGGGRSDQPDGHRADGQSKSVPRGKRIRKQRSDRTGDAAG